ncbi:MAG: transglutaminaseTgpA domain-containing protein [Myxococcota bacterium]
MSRLEFRAEVPDARPPSAWMLVTVAGATLWITEQLRPWAIALQVVAILFSLVTRNRPSGWQTSPITLNLGMFGIVGATIALALQGNPATVSLAHFAALTQGLQLLDTRPRKSEFLLVALALFQVILAANLTDSLFFPPLLVVFLIAATWTLLVHTLRTEAIEAGERIAIHKAINTGLLRMTLIASVLSVAVALVLFVMLPRMRSSMVQGGLGSSLAVAGFSDQVELGTIGRIRKDPTVVLRVQTLEGRMPSREQSYWRGLAFDTFDGRQWSISPISKHRGRFHVPGTPRFGVDLNGGDREFINLVQQVIREPVEAGVVFSAGVPRRVEGPLDVLEFDVNGGLYAPRQIGERVRYTVRTDLRLPDDSALAADRTAPPLDRAQPPDPSGTRFLRLPELSPEIHALALEMTAGAVSDAERARRLEQELRRRGSYTDAPPDLARLDGLSPIERFLLGELSGHCEYFASSMVVLARSLDMPARLVNGFAGGRLNKFGGFVELARSDAHTWVEIHFEKHGWVRYDPTPPDLRLREAFAGNLGERLAEIYSAVETWWFQRVVDFDSSDQIQALKSVWTAWRSWRSTTPVGSPEAQKPERSPGFEPVRDLPWAIILPGAGALALLFELRRRRRRARRPEAEVPESYRRALRLLARRGLHRAPATPARQFAHDVTPELPEPAARAFRDLTECYLSERFGGRSDPRAPELLESLRREFRAQARA